MVDPTTANILLAVPTRGSDPGTWDVPVNSNSAAIDGYFGGVQTISVSNTPLTLTAPAGTVSAGGGPTQAQNAVLRFTGTLSTNVTVTLPLPGYYVIENLTTGNFLLIFAAVTPTQVIAVDQGMIQHVYNDGANVKFVNLGEIGKVEMWAGVSTMPAWVTACTVPPYLLNDGTVYNFSTYPYLGKKMLGNFGGNGITTFGVPDHRGRMALPYDGTGTRITAGGCGLNGQTLGAVLDEQTITLTASEVPNLSVSVSVSGGVSGSAIVPTQGFSGANQSGTDAGVGNNNTGSFNVVAPLSASFSGGGSGSTTSGGGGAHPNVQPSQVTGISVIRAA